MFFKLYILATVLVITGFLASAPAQASNQLIPPAGTVDAKGNVSSCPAGQAITWSIVGDGGHFECTIVTPVGGVMFFNLGACPTGWVAADGTNGTPDLRGEFIRGMDNGRGIDTPTGGRTLGSEELATSIMTDWRDNATNAWEYSMSDFGDQSTNADEVTSTLALRDPIDGAYPGAINRSDNPNANPNAWNSQVHKVKVALSSVRPRNIALLACIKQ